jgi:membrane fusion protein, multidrug efflux system
MTMASPDRGTAMDARSTITEVPAAASPSPAAPRRRRLLRLVLLVLVPLLALGGFGAWYFSGGRYVTTDNAYVGAPKVMVASQVTGPIATVSVREGQHVAAGDELFRIDPEPYEIALADARAALGAAELSLAALKESWQRAQTAISAAQATVDYEHHHYDRIESLAGRQFSTEADLDKALSDKVNAEQQLAAARSAADEIAAKLGGDPDLPEARYPPVTQAKASLAEAERDLRLTRILAPIPGTATQTDLVVPGRFLATGTAAMAIIDTDHAWVDANPKETDLSAVKTGDAVDISVDAYPDHVFHGTVRAVSPGTGAQFSVLPAQNASGNWVKVVQRIPIRIDVTHGDGEPPLRAGMSAWVSIDTGAPREAASRTASRLE